MGKGERAAERRHAAKGLQFFPFASVIARYFPTKAVQTRRDNYKELANLMKVFAHMPVDAIAPMHVREYLDIRDQTAKVRANREKVSTPI